MSPVSHSTAITPATGLYLTAAFYKFVDLPDFTERKAPLLAFCEAHQVKGLILLASEGINSTIAGAPDDVHAVLTYLRQDPLLADLQHKESFSAKPPFYRMKVRLKAEIVTMGQPDIDPLASVGTYVEPENWNALISEPGTILIDTRNDYEVAVGTFAGAIDPQTTSFRDFPAWFRQERERLLGDGAKPPKVAMFCTGGIRCEKSTAFLKAEGIDEVYHLRCGILKYLETVPAQNSLWQGECFVFDQRVSVGHGLVLGTHALCHACRRPITAADQASPLYEEGVSCPACHATRTEAQREGYRERHRQELLAAKRGEEHIGARLHQL